MFYDLELVLFFFPHYMSSIWLRLRFTAKLWMVKKRKRKNTICPFLPINLYLRTFLRAEHCRNEREHFYISFTKLFTVSVGRKCTTNSFTTRGQDKKKEKKRKKRERNFALCGNISKVISFTRFILFLVLLTLGLFWNFLAFSCGSLFLKRCFSQLTQKFAYCWRNQLLTKRWALLWKSENVLTFQKNLVHLNSHKKFTFPPLIRIHFYPYLCVPITSVICFSAPHCYTFIKF